MNRTGIAAAIDCVTIEIGGVPVLFRSDDAAFHTMVNDRYPGFVCLDSLLKPGVRSLRFDVELLGAGELSSDEDVRVWKTGECWCARRGDFFAQWHPASGRGHIRQELNPYALNSILRIVHTICLAPAQGFLLHAASAIHNHSALVFSGVSGAGKSTISGLAPADATLLTDEISYIRSDGGRYFAWGTPFAGELGIPGANTSAAIAKLFFLEKGPANQIQPLQKAEAIPLLLRNILFFCDDKELVQRVFDSACDFVERVPVYRLTFVPEPAVWSFVA